MVTWIQLAHGMDQQRTVLLQEVSLLSDSDSHCQALWSTSLSLSLSLSDVKNATSAILYDL